MFNAQSGGDKWFQNLGSNRAARLRLFCFAYAGGGASVFRGWADALPASVEVCPVQLPGRENRYKETPFTDFEELVAEVSLALQPALNMPFAFFGYSLGALIAFEVARKIEQSPLIQPNLRRLIVAASQAPQFRTRDADTYRLSRDRFIARLREMGGTPHQILANKELLDYFLPIVRADFELLANYYYRPGPPLNCPLTIFGGEQDTEIDREKLLEWQVHTNGPVHINFFGGNHFFINSNRPAVLQELGRRLNQPF